jgi:hypothetical protein
MLKIIKFLDLSLTSLISLFLFFRPVMKMLGMKRFYASLAAGAG